jgi:SAM-dependent methyltransferase
MKRAQWNRLAETFEEEVCDISREETADQLASLVRLALPSVGSCVLADLGCGLGSFLLKYRRHFSKMIAVDFASKILARAKKRCARLDGVEWHCMEIAKAGHVLGSVADLTVCMNVITSPDAAVRSAIWRSVARVTKAGGYALVVLPSLESERMVQAVSNGKAKDSGPGKNGLVLREDAVQKHFLRSELEPALARYGFELFRIRRAYYPWRKEGMRKPHKATGNPWDWACLALRCPKRPRNTSAA